jgi:hypothetical protein
MRKIRYFVIAQYATHLKWCKCVLAGLTGYLRRAVSAIKFRSLSTLSHLKFKKKKKF